MVVDVLRDGVCAENVFRIGIWIAEEVCEGDSWECVAGVFV